MKKFLLLIVFCVAFVATALCQAGTTMADTSFSEQIAQVVASWVIAFASTNPTWFSLISFLIIVFGALSEYLGQTKKFTSNNVLQAVFSIIKKIAAIFVSSKNKNV